MLCKNPPLDPPKLPPAVVAPVLPPPASETTTLVIPTGTVQFVDEVKTSLFALPPSDRQIPDWQDGED